VPPGTTIPADQIAIPPPTNTPPEEIVPAGTINFPAMDLNQVLQFYAELVNRTVLRPTSLPAPTITLKTQTALTRSEAKAALDDVLAMNGIAMINFGEKFVKAVPLTQAGQVGAEFNTTAITNLPNMGQFVTKIVPLRYSKPSAFTQILTPFSSGVANAVIPFDDNGILVLRDLTENVKRMSEIIEKVDVMLPAEFISLVVPIKYALASDIYSAIGQLGGGGGGGTIGSGARGTAGGGLGARTTGTGTSGFNRPGGTTYPGSTVPGSTPFGTQGTTTPFGTTPGGAGAPGGVGSSFTDRLRNIISRASSPGGGGGDFQIIGPNKIIADERTNSLLIFAMRQDMETITNIIGKLDVILAQVLIEAIIMEVNLKDEKKLGISYLEKQAHGIGNYVNGVGAINNGTFLTPSSFSALTNGAGGLTSGFSYLASLGGDLDISVQALQTDSRVNVLSRPRVQTSHAVPANMFVGDTVPYITGTTFGYGGVGGSQSVYQEKQVGISLQVLPLVNPDGLVVMDIQSDIDQITGSTVIDNNSVPIISKRSANAKVAVKDRDTVMLGGFISSTRTHANSGVPFLKDVPLLGTLFRSTDNTHNRTELIVLLRPTVLPTPEAAAAIATAERNHLGGVRRAEAEIQADEAKANRKAERELNRQ
jgi:general secretion pathway protein D